MVVPMSPSAIAPEKKAQPQPLRPTAILHRTPWQPPVAVSGQGIYITLEDGRQVIDAAGGAAVTCLGNGHPVVLEALKEQVDKLACELVGRGLLGRADRTIRCVHWGVFERACCGGL
jgi:4-aminobutyrate aminotransferase-like enzyme